MKLQSARDSGGFALVVTISLMVLLVVIATGLLTLSTVSLRSSSHEQARMIAQANARLALTIAIGELQQHVGPDQRITAGSEITDPDSSLIKNPHWTGVWDSWRAGTAVPPSTSATPDPASEHRTIPASLAAGMAPTYTVNRSDHFRSWLLSLNPGEAASVTTAKDLDLNGVSMPNKDATAVQLVGEGSLGTTASTTDFVSARLIKVQDPISGNTSGRYGWWVGDESQKARVIDDTYQTSGGTLTSADNIFRSQAPGSTGTKRVEGLENMTKDSELAGLPSLLTLDLVSGANGRPGQKNFHSVTPHSYGVIADVREGGLKRDLSTLFERKIDNTETGDSFMLYKFNVKDAWASPPPLLNTYNTPQECVPIQDLAAYYQLYDGNATNVTGIDHSTWKKGIQYNSASLPNTIQTSVPDYGDQTTYNTKFINEYSTLYRNPVVIKVQFIMSLFAAPITAAERALLPSNASIPPTDTHSLKLAVVPAITLWNPFNVPITMGSGNNLCQQFVLKVPAFYFQFVKTRTAGGIFPANPNDLSKATFTMGSLFGRDERLADLLKLNIGRTAPITLQPGQVRVFSISAPGGTGYVNPITANELVRNDPSYLKNRVDAAPGWNPLNYLLFPSSYSDGKSRRSGAEDNINVVETRILDQDSILRPGYNISLNPGDTLKFKIVAENPGRVVSRISSPVGAAMCFYMAQRNYSAGITDINRRLINLRQSSLVSRFGANPSNPNDMTALPSDFNQLLMAQGMPGGNAQITYEDITASSIINAGGRGKAFLQMSMMAGCETSELANGGALSGRKLPSRPFLHSSPIQPTFIDQNDAAAPYNHGWNWWIEDMNSELEANVQVTPTGDGYYGGGYSAESGVPRVIQQEIPVTPPISIATLSHARLGGFSLAHEAPAGEGSTNSGYMEYYYDTGGPIDYPKTAQKSFQRVTTTGQAGLYPHVLQAIGNSYANPQLAANTAYNLAWRRFYHKQEGVRRVTFADHSYLANKALWDDFFFSSITPQPKSVQIFGVSTDRDAKTVATEFFFPATGVASKPLPNRRIEAYTNGLDANKLATLFTQKDVFTDGLADKIAANLMVKGPFNINSTSVAAWKVLFSSLRGKPVAYLNGGITPTTATPTGTPVGPGCLPNGAPVTSINSPNDPAGQWNGWRDITDAEIDALATAMVKQVKLRGPFLSLSEFINRRLDGGNTDLSTMGALQAALDDPTVPINANFRTPGRMLDSETSAIPFPFPKAAKGPIAYGSAAYVDQADVLRNLAEQLTPRGDTFVIRTYGDALDAKGNIIARAWCEAVVQRNPDYVDPKDANNPSDTGDAPETKQANLTSQANKLFGRKVQMISFRWLNSSEV